MPDIFDQVIADLHSFGMAFPEAQIRSPWPGHQDLVVRDKTFTFLSVWDDVFRLSCKLPISGEAALIFPFCSPTGYGLGKSGWVTAEFRPGEEMPVPLFKDWILESYKARAPKKLIALL